MKLNKNINTVQCSGWGSLIMGRVINIKRVHTSHPISSVKLYRRSALTCRFKFRCLQKLHNFFQHIHPIWIDFCLLNTFFVTFRRSWSICAGLSSIIWPRYPCPLLVTAALVNLHAFYIIPAWRNYVVIYVPRTLCIQ